jgi:pteridine reductase
MKTALVTGAAVRVGRATALELAASGFRVALHYNRSRGPAERVLDEVRALGGDGFLVAGDLATVDGCRAVADAVAAQFQGLHLLVNNASAFEPVAFAAITPEQWEAMLGVNLRAPFLLSQALLPLLRAADPADVGAPPDQHGVVIHLCDIGADRPVSGYAHYSVSKAGLVMLVKAMAVELAPAVRTLGLSPGQVIWPEDYSEALRSSLSRRIPLGRVGTPEDIARLVRFLTLEAHYLNGDVIPVDGGLHCRY